MREQGLLFDPASTLPVGACDVQAWGLVRVDFAPIEDVMARAFSVYVGQYRALPGVVRVAPGCYKRAVSWLAAQGWGAVVVRENGGTLACEVEVPYKEKRSDDQH